MDTIVEKSNHVHPNYKVDCLKDKQSECLLAAKASDLLAVLPTGYGKTIIIQCLPFLEEENRLVVIVSPLNTIIAEQAARFGQHCRVIDSDFVKKLECDADREKSLADIIDNNVLYLLGSPEKMTSIDMQKFLMMDTLSKKVL